VVAGASSGYAVFLLPTFAGVRTWLVPVLIAAAVVGVGMLLASVVARSARTSMATMAVVAAGLAAVLAPAVATASVVTDGLGPFDTPFEAAGVTMITQSDMKDSQYRAAITARDFEGLIQHTGATILFVTDTSAAAANFILASGREVLPIGGFTGAVPAPTLAQIRHDITTGRVIYAIVPVSPPGHDARIVWIRRHCHAAQIDRPAPVRFGLFNCSNRVMP
jgi:hypothetical protein